MKYLVYNLLPVLKPKKTARIFALLVFATPLFSGYKSVKIPVLINNKTFWTLCFFPQFNSKAQHSVILYNQEKVEKMKVLSKLTIFFTLFHSLVFCQINSHPNDGKWFSFKSFKRTTKKSMEADLKNFKIWKKKQTELQSRLITRQQSKHFLESLFFITGSLCFILISLSVEWSWGD